MRFTEARRIGQDGPVVVTFLDDEMRRRTVVVPFTRSGLEDVGEIVEHVNRSVGMFPPKLNNGTGSEA